MRLLMALFHSFFRHIMPSLFIMHLAVNCLIHIGFGTVDLKGEGFTVYKKLHDEVKQGDLLLLEFDFDFLSQTCVFPWQHLSLYFQKKARYTEQKCIT
jgi:hypothetical protein